MTDQLIRRAVCSLMKLQALRLYCLGSVDSNEEGTFVLNSTKSLKGVVCTAVTRTLGYLQRTIQVAEALLEVLTLRDITFDDQAFDTVSSQLQTFDVGPRQREKSLIVSSHNGSAFSRLSHLTIANRMTDNVISIFALRPCCFV